MSHPRSLSPSLPDPVHATHLHSDSAKYRINESGKFTAKHTEVHHHILHHLEHRGGHHANLDMHHMLRIHNEAQGHGTHGHFDHYQPHLGIRPSSAGARRPSLTRPNVLQAPVKVIVDSNTIQKGFHTLGKHPFLMSICFLGLNLHNIGLTDDDIHFLNDCNNVAYVDISRNSLSNLIFLNRFSSLVQLNACGNAITDCLNFSPPKCDAKHAWSDGHHAVGSMLTLANLCNNKIALIQDLSHHPFLETLLLKQNCINVITGLSSLRFLKILDLSYNNIQVIEGLDNLTIEELSLEGNRITSLKGLSKLPRLSLLNISRNEITSLQPLSQCTTLVTLKLSFNKIEIIREVEHLANLPWLSLLEMAGNVCVTKKYFRERVIYRLPLLNTLDMTVISAEEKIRAYNLYNSEGGDIAPRREVFNVVFPNKTFENTGPSLIDEELDLELPLK